MEWEDYYEDYLMFKKMSTDEGTTHQAAAIIGQDGKVWAQIGNYFPQLTAEERNAIIPEFDEPGMLTTMGLYLGGTKYVVTELNQPCESMTIKKTSAALVIGIYYITTTSNLCNVIVERVGVNLIKRGYKFYIGRMEISSARKVVWFVNGLRHLPFLYFFYETSAEDAGVPLPEAI